MDGEVVDTSIIASTPGFPGEQRLGIYQNAYIVRLTECLENEFPVLVETVSQEGFAQFVRGYLKIHPSRSYTLGKLSAFFVEYLDRSRPERGSESPGPDWFDFVIDVARFEATINDVFDGPGSEGIEGFSLNAADRHEYSARGDLELSLNPSLRVIRCEFPVHQYYRLQRNRQSAEYPFAEATIIGVYRRDYVVRYREISEFQARLLQSIDEQGSLVKAIEEIDRSGEAIITADGLRQAMELFSRETLIGHKNDGQDLKSG